MSDPAGTVSSTVDLLGRLVTYRDALSWGSHFNYDQVGRLVSTGLPGSSIARTYDPNSGDLVSVRWNGQTPVEADVGYDPATARMTSVNYYTGRGAQARLAVGYDTFGNEADVSFTTGGGATDVAADQITKSLGGRTVTERIDTGGPFLVDPNPGGPDFVYDGAGRLTRAYINGGVADYSYAANPSADNCAYPAAPANTNRASVTFTPNTGSATVTHTCYNNADQATSTTVNGATSAASYDGHGNQTADATATYGWDSSDRLSQLASATYIRDALDRTIKRVDGASTIYYAYSGFSDSPAAVLDANGNLAQLFVALPGGVLVTVQGASPTTWSFPNLAGDYVTTTDDGLARTGGFVTYDPWGSEYPTGTTVANAAAGVAFGADGTSGKIEEHAAQKPIVLLGARPMSPTDGRFLSVDPVQGGCANAYVYVRGDPANTSDLSGLAGCGEGLEQAGQSIGAAQIVASDCSGAYPTGSGDRQIYLANVVPGGERTAAESCFLNLTDNLNDSKFKLVGESSSGDPFFYFRVHGSGEIGIGFYTYRDSIQSGPSVDFNTGQAGNGVIHFIPQLPC